MDTILFGLRFTGIKPPDITAGELAEVISSFEDMVAFTVQHTRPQVPKKQLGIGLIRLEDQSIGLEFSTKLPELTWPAYTMITSAMSQGQYLRLSSDTLKSLRKIQAFARSHECDSEFSSHNGSLKVLAVLSPQVVIPHHPVLQANTVIHAYIKRVGGNDPRVMVQLPNGHGLYCGVKNEAIARQLGAKLYQWAGLVGVARLDSDSLEILEFTVNGLSDYDDTKSVKESIRQLSATTSIYYADVSDVDQYVKDLRE